MPWLPALRRQRRIPIGPTIPLWILRHRAMLHYRERDPMSVPFPNNDRLFCATRAGSGAVLFARSTANVLRRVEADEAWCQ